MCSFENFLLVVLLTKPDKLIIFWHFVSIENIHFLRIERSICKLGSTTQLKQKQRLTLNIGTYLSLTVEISRVNLTIGFQSDVSAFISFVDLKFDFIQRNQNENIKAFKVKTDSSLKVNPWNYRHYKNLYSVWLMMSKKYDEGSFIRSIDKKLFFFAKQ